MAIHLKSILNKSKNVNSTLPLITIYWCSINLINDLKNDSSLSSISFILGYVFWESDWLSMVMNAYYTLD